MDEFRSRALALDAGDTLAGKRRMFDLPRGLIYLDGNSLGPLTYAAAERIADVVRTEWGQGLIRSWNSHDWIDLPQRTGDKIARIVGAAPGTVTVAESTSVNLYNILGAAVHLGAGRSAILSDTGNFPTDLYAAQGLAEIHKDKLRLRTVPADELEGALSDDTAVLMLTEVDFRTGRRHDMERLTRKAHEAGALVVWDLSHSAGALPVRLEAADADFAVGCGYKYLNGGPGAPAFAYVAPRLLDQARPVLCGWMGHQAPFDFTLDYAPAVGVARMRVGTPSVIALSGLHASLAVFDDVDMTVVERKLHSLTSLFIDVVRHGCGDLRLISPADAAERGGHVSFLCPDGYAVIQALAARNVIGDFRAPDFIRFGFAPLYLSHQDVVEAGSALVEVMNSGEWKSPRFAARAKVT